MYKKWAFIFYATSFFSPDHSKPELEGVFRQSKAPTRFDLTDLLLSTNFTFLLLIDIRPEDYR